MKELSFEWDERKNRANISKHQVPFEEAQTAFADESGRLIHDPDHSDDEDRFVLLARSARFRVLVVCHAYRRGDVVRIISARRANRREKETYEEAL